jgi:hypothetical protein
MKEITGKNRKQNNMEEDAQKRHRKHCTDRKRCRIENERV